MSLWSKVAGRVPMTGPNMHIGGRVTGLPVRSGAVASVLRSTDAGDPCGLERPGHLKGDGSAWSGRVQLRSTGRRARSPGLQTHVRQDLLDHRLFQDGRDDLQLAAAREVTQHFKAMSAFVPSTPRERNEHA